MSHPEYNQPPDSTIHERRTRQQYQNQIPNTRLSQSQSQSQSRSQNQTHPRTTANIGLGVIPPTPHRDDYHHQGRSSSSSTSHGTGTGHGQTPRVTLPPIRIPDIDYDPHLHHHQQQQQQQRSSSGLHPSQQQQHQNQSRSSPSTAHAYNGTRHLPHPVSSPGQHSYLSTPTTYFHSNPLSSSSSPLSIDGRVLRSPHPPLTALLNPVSYSDNAHHHHHHQQQQQQRPSSSSSSSSAQYRSSHFLAQQQLQQDQLQAQLHSHSPVLPPSHQQQYLAQDHQHLHPSHQNHQHHQHQHHHLQRPYHTLSPLDQPLTSPSLHTTFTAPPPSAGASGYPRASPVVIPPPLRFNYSATPPEPSPGLLQQYALSASSHSNPLAPTTRSTNSNPALRAQYFPEFLIPAMPPRRKAAVAAGGSTANNEMTVSSTPQTVSSATSSARPRKGAKGNGWTMEHTYNSDGQKKEVIVIDDSSTPEHPPRKRTRAQVAAENAAAAAQSGSGVPHGNSHGSQNGHQANGYAASVASTSSAGKKRKVDEGTDAAAKKKGKASGVSHPMFCLPMSTPEADSRLDRCIHSTPGTWTASGACASEPAQHMG